MDVIVASKNAKLLPSHVQLFNAPWDLGIRKAKQILFENRFIDADEALDLGLVSEVTEDGDHYEAAFAQAQRFAENSLLTLRMLKHSINSAQDAMGYRQHIEASHSNYMMMHMAQEISQADAGIADRQLSGVADALRKEEDG